MSTDAATRGRGAAAMPAATSCAASVAAVSCAASVAAVSLAASVAAVAPAGPVLVVADNDAIGRNGPAWAHDLAAVGRPHRVRLCDADLADSREVAAVLREAASLGAVVIVGAGEGGVVEVARRVAVEARLPFVAAASAVGPVD
jgi:glycerol dehydrogenase-like iron-containing ADH family enzyme